MADMKKRKTGLALLVLALLLPATMAYFIARTEKVNALSIGGNEIEIEEEFEPPKPGEKTVKNPKIVNCGIVDCYVRAKVVLSDNRVEPYLRYQNDRIHETEELWKEKEGWFYYQKKLVPGEKTEPLFTHIILDETIPNEWKGFCIDVLVESVQSEGFASCNQAFAALEAGE